MPLSEESLRSEHRQPSLNNLSLSCSGNFSFPVFCHFCSSTRWFLWTIQSPAWSFSWAWWWQICPRGWTHTSVYSTTQPWLWQWSSDGCYHLFTSCRCNLHLLQATSQPGYKYKYVILPFQSNPNIQISNGLTQFNAVLVGSVMISLWPTVAKEELNLR